MPSSPPPTSPEAKYGSCLCKAIRYCITGDPIVNKVCHCTHCKKATGSAFMWNGLFEEKQINVVQGEELLTKYSDNGTRSGYTLERYFCKICGSNMFNRPLRPELSGKNLRIVTLGTLDGPIDWMPAGEVFPEHRVPFVDIKTPDEKTKL